MCVIVVDMVICMLWLRFCGCVIVCIDVMVMSSAYEVSCSGGCGMSDVYMLKMVGERTPPLETPVLD